MSAKNIWLDEARIIAATCWSEDDTKHLPVDAALAEAIAQRIAAWMKTAAQAESNASYYRGLVVKCGKVFGREATIADDGTEMDEVLCAKVPELVEKLERRAARFGSMLQGAQQALLQEGARNCKIEQERDRLRSMIEKVQAIIDAQRERNGGGK